MFPAVIERLLDCCIRSLTCIIFKIIIFVPALAAGKSTFVRLLEEHDREWEVVPEPIARWCNVQTQHDEYEVQSKITTNIL